MDRPKNSFNRLGFTFCLEDRRLLMAFGLEDHRPPVPLRFHLTVHCLSDIGWRFNSLEFDPGHPGSPLISGVVEDLLEPGIDHLP